MKDLSQNKFLVIGKNLGQKTEENIVGVIRLYEQLICDFKKTNFIPSYQNW